MSGIWRSIFSKRWRIVRSTYTIGTNQPMSPPAIAPTIASTNGVAQDRDAPEREQREEDRER